jgi:hypothetical protein
MRMPVTWLRHRGIRPQDVFVASYPRSGSTWLRFLLFEILTKDSALFTSVNRVVADIGYHHDAPSLLPGGGRLLKTHEAYRGEYRKAVYLVRDGRDVVFSEFAYQKARGWIADDFDRFLKEFVHGSVSKYGSWSQHVQSWVRSPLAGQGNLLTIRFEDMRADTEKALTDIIAFLGVSVNPNIIREAIANNTVEKMKNKEDHNPQFNGSPANGNGLRFVRSGSVGGWRGRLSEMQVELFSRQTGSTLEALGYSSNGSRLESKVDVQVGS